MHTLTCTHTHCRGKALTPPNTHACFQSNTNTNTGPCVCGGQCKTSSLLLQLTVTFLITNLDSGTCLGDLCVGPEFSACVCVSYLGGVITDLISRQRAHSLHHSKSSQVLQEGDSLAKSGAHRYLQVQCEHGATQWAQPHVPSSPCSTVNKHYVKICT